MTHPFTCWTAGVGAADAARAGGKAAALGELARAGLPVPRGFVVTTAAFSLHVDALDPDGAARAALGALAADD
ncbi:MAG: PEP/pyruvate-binding domain-containing protein, partial [Streptosporangiaceae bacterium]